MREALSRQIRNPRDILDALYTLKTIAFETAYDLDRIWQDPNAGDPWRIIGYELERLESRLSSRLAAFPVY